MPTRETSAINVTAVDMGTGRLRYGWNRHELKRNLRISEPTLKRYISLLATHATAEFDYVPRQRSFTHYQIHAIRTIRSWFAYMNQAQIVKRLQDEGIPENDYEETA